MQWRKQCSQPEEQQNPVSKMQQIYKATQTLHEANKITAYWKKAYIINTAKHIQTQMAYPMTQQITPTGATPYSIHTDACLQHNLEHALQQLAQIQSSTRLRQTCAACYSGKQLANGLIIGTAQRRTTAMMWPRITSCLQQQQYLPSYKDAKEQVHRRRNRQQIYKHINNHLNKMLREKWNKCPVGLTRSGEKANQTYIRPNEYIDRKYHRQNTRCEIAIAERSSIRHATNKAQALVKLIQEDANRRDPEYVTAEERVIIGMRNQTTKQQCKPDNSVQRARKLRAAKHNNLKQIIAQFLCSGSCTSKLYFIELVYVVNILFCFCPYCLCMTSFV